MVKGNVGDNVKEALKQGKSKEEIYLSLLKEGVTVERIEKGFDEVVAREEKEDSQKRTIRIIVTIGAILVGAGIFSFVASNWQEMTKTVKVLIILGSMIAAYTGGWLLKERWNYAKTGGALILLGCIIYGAGIFLVAQMFNIRANWPDGFILWMIGTIAMAFAINMFGLFYLAVPLAIIAFTSHPFVIFQRFSFHDPFLLTSSLLLLIATLIAFVSGFLIRRRMSQEARELF